jgi:hypothetical protein
VYVLKELSKVSLQPLMGLLTLQPKAQRLHYLIFMGYIKVLVLEEEFELVLRQHADKGVCDEQREVPAYVMKDG